MSEFETSKEFPKKVSIDEFVLQIQRGLPAKTTYFEVDALRSAFIRTWESRDEDEEDSSPDRDFILTRHEKGFGISSIIIQYDFRVRYPQAFSVDGKLQIRDTSRDEKFIEIDTNSAEDLIKLGECVSIGLGLAQGNS